MEKTCSIMVSKGKSQTLAGRGDFPKMWFFLHQGILTFFDSCFYAGGKMLIFFGCHFFWFCKGMFQKTAKKNCTF